MAEGKERYSIIRVDEDCPKEIDSKLVCNIKRDKNGIGNCYCRYGDTKKQLIRKVSQVIKRKLKGGLVLRNTKINETYNIQKTISAEAVAKEIVEFLGVEDESR